MERYFLHKNRYVVVSTGEEASGLMPVKLVGLHSGLTGVARRGRPPKYAKPVPVSELVETQAPVADTPPSEPPNPFPTNMEDDDSIPIPLF